MPAMTCARCGMMTNSATSDYWTCRRADGKAGKCFVRWNDKGQMIEGCALNEADPISQKIYRSMIHEHNQNHNITR